MPVLTKLREFLDQNKVAYEVLSHRQAFTAQEVAEAQHVPGKEVAKVVILRSGAQFVMVVLPAPYALDLERARRAIGQPDLVFASEIEFSNLFPQCEPGAMPPFGNLYDMAVWVDETLLGDEMIVFNAGTHTQTIRMRYADFARLVQPKVASLGGVKQSGTGMPLRNWMTRNPQTIGPQDTLEEAQQRMARGRFRRLPVVDDKGRLIGILTDGDLRQHIGYWSTTRVDAAMIENPTTVGQDESIEHAADMMIEYKIGGLPVVQDGNLVGIITDSDLLQGLLHMLRHERTAAPGSKGGKHAPKR